MSARALALVAVLAAACGDNQPSGEDMSMPEDMAMAQDLAMRVDMRMPLMPPTYGPTFMCGGTACGGGTQCCVSLGGGGAAATCLASCADAGAPVQCQWKGQCPNGNPCCTTARLMGMSGGLESVECANSKSECVPSLDLNSGLFRSRLCTSNADCTEGISTGFNKCCQLAMGGQEQFICLDATTIGFLNPPCL
jgi:hypothetical protein